MNEYGLYNLILASRKADAKKFKRWITHEVIPSIMKHGGYIAGQDTLNEDELIAKAYLIVTRKLEEREQQIEELKPKALFADSVSSSEDTILVGQMAVILKQNGINIGEYRLFKWLRENGYLVKEKNGDYNRPTQKSMDLQLFKCTTTIIQRSKGTVIRNTPKITGKGQIYFVNKFKKLMEV